MALAKPANGAILDYMDLIIKPEMMNAVVLALSEGGAADQKARVEQVIVELTDFLQHAEGGLDRTSALLMAKNITEACARRLDRLGSGTGTAQ